MVSCPMRRTYDSGQFEQRVANPLLIPDGEVGAPFPYEHSAERVDFELGGMLGCSELWETEEAEESDWNWALWNCYRSRERSMETLTGRKAV